MKRPPLCSRCQNRHFNFVKCERAPEWREPAPVRVQWLPPPEGTRDFGDRLLSYERMGDSNVFMLKRPKRDDGPEAA